MKKKLIFLVVIVVVIIILTIITFNNIRIRNNIVVTDTNTSYSISDSKIYDSTYDERVGIKNHVKRYNSENETLKLDDSTVLIGDSITEGLNDQEGLLKPGVVNRGISGITTLDVAKNLDKIYLSMDTKNVSQVFILLGVNDSMIYSVDDNYDSVSTATNIMYIVQEIHEDNPDIKINVISTLPVNPYINDWDNKDKNDGIIKVNEILEAELQPYVNFIDIYDDLINSNGNLIREYTIDGTHYNTKGYKVVVGLVREHVIS